MSQDRGVPGRNEAHEAILVKAAAGFERGPRPAASNQNEEASPEGQQRGLDVIDPPHDLQWLVSLMDDSDELGQCVRAVVQGTCSYGYRLVPAFDGGQVPEALKSEVEAEWCKLATFLEWCGSSDNVSSLLEKCETDLQLVGQFYQEVVRLPVTDEIIGLEHVVAAQIKHCPLDPEPVLVSTKIRREIPGGRVEIAERKEWKRFRLYCQETVGAFFGPGSGKLYVYYKSFGDPRSYHRDTGKKLEETDLAKLKAEHPKTWQTKLACELIHVPLYNPSGSSYGKPPWIGALWSIVGSRAAEKINYSTFTNNNVPSYAVLVSGGALTAGSIKRIESYIESSIKGNDNWSRFVVLEAESFFQDADVASSIKLEIKPLADLQRAEGMFSGYRTDCRDAVRASFRMPAIIVGRSQDWSGPVISGARRLVDETVYTPERQRIDRYMNRTLLPALGIKYHRFESNTPNTTDNVELITLLANAEKTGASTPRIGRMVMARVLNEELGDFPADFDPDVPFSLTMAEAVKNQADPAEPGQQVTALKSLLGMPGADDDSLPWVQVAKSLLAAAERRMTHAGARATQTRSGE